MMPGEQLNPLARVESAELYEGMLQLIEFFHNHHELLPHFKKDFKAELPEDFDPRSALSDEQLQAYREEHGQEIAAVLLKAYLKEFNRRGYPFIDWDKLQALEASGRDFDDEQIKQLIKDSSPLFKQLFLLMRTINRGDANKTSITELGQLIAPELSPPSASPKAKKQHRKLLEGMMQEDRTYMYTLSPLSESTHQWYQRLLTTFETTLRNPKVPNLVRVKAEEALKKFQEINRENQDSAQIDASEYLTKLIQLLADPEKNPLAASECLSDFLMEAEEDQFANLLAQLEALKDEAELSSMMTASQVDEFSQFLRDIKKLEVNDEQKYPIPALEQLVLLLEDKGKYPKAIPYVQQLNAELHQKLCIQSYNRHKKQLLQAVKDYLDPENDENDEKIVQQINKIIKLTDQLKENKKEDIKVLTSVLSNTKLLILAPGQNLLGDYIVSAATLQGKPNNTTKKLGTAMMVLAVIAGVALGLTLPPAAAIIAAGVAAGVAVTGGGIGFFSGRTTGLAKATKELGETWEKKEEEISPNKQQ